MKRPSFQFYPADWRKDPALSTCSLAARGLWIELMCVAHESDEYGTLSINGKPMTEQQIARAVGEAPSVIAKLLAELESSGVFSRDDNGSIYSRRMIKDERLRNIRADAGRLGGNPNLLNQKVNQMDKQKVNHASKQSLTPSSSSSSSSSEITPKPLFDLFGRFWTAYPNKAGRKSALKAWEKLSLVENDPRIAEIRAGLTAAIASREWKKDNGEFIPHAATWLNGERWRDEYHPANVIPIGGMEAPQIASKVAL